MTEDHKKKVGDTVELKVDAEVIFSDEAGYIFVIRKPRGIVFYPPVTHDGFMSLGKKALELQNEQSRTK